MRIEGPTPFQVDPNTGVEPRVGSLILPHRTLVTAFPAVHAFQHAHFLTSLDAHREQNGQRPLVPDERDFLLRHTVDLFFREGMIYIRPIPECMAEALEADAQLQELVPKHQIKFLHAQHPRVRDALRHLGELWRISTPPQSGPEIEEFIRSSRVALSGRPIYYLNPGTGTRWLTFQALQALAQLEDRELAQHLVEIARFLGLINLQGFPELRFFPAGTDLRAEELRNVPFETLPTGELRRFHGDLVEHLRSRVPLELQTDDLKNALWWRQMLHDLTSRPDGALVDEVVDGLDEAFYRQILWLPGGRFDRGELLFDPIFELAKDPTHNHGIQRLCDETVKGFFLNFLREFGELEFVNMGRVLSPPTHYPRGRQGVYVAEIKAKRNAHRTLRIIRMQRWGIHQHLEDNDPLLDAILKAHEYTHYVLDRRLACHQLGMKVPLRVACWDIPEDYRARDGATFKIWASYFERDYIPGTAVNKLPPHKLSDPHYAVRLAELLGHAAAANLVAGRTEERTGEVVFDRGDELLIEDHQGLPAELTICDHSRSFGDFLTPLRDFAKAYAAPINVRLDQVSQPREFAGAYLQSLEQRLTEIRQEFLERQSAFRQLFQHLPVVAGSFGFRWLKTLERLEATDPAEVVAAIRRQIVVQTTPAT